MSIAAWLASQRVLRQVQQCGQSTHRPFPSPAHSSPRCCRPSAAKPLQHLKILRPWLCSRSPSSRCSSPPSPAPPRSHRSRPPQLRFGGLIDDPLGARGQLLQVVSAQRRKRLPRLLQQAAPRVRPTASTLLRHRLLRLPRYCSRALITLSATADAETLYVPAAIDCCNAATLSVRTSLPDNACATSTAARAQARLVSLPACSYAPSRARAGPELGSVFAARLVPANAATSVASKTCCGPPIPFI